MPTRAWAEELGSCVTDVIASRPEDPLRQLAHLLSRPNARPDWNETASAYAKRHSLEQHLQVAIDAVGLTVLEAATPGAIDQLCRELRALAQPQVAKARGHRVVTYNLLSPELGEPARFPCNDAADLDPPTRLARIRARLAEHMAVGAVLCLQEVSAAWAVKLAPFFEEKRYTVVSAMYHSMVFTGYMGNLLCWPAELYECLDADSLRVKDTKKWPPPVPPPVVDPSEPPSRPPFDPWVEAGKKENAIVMARLRPRAAAAGAEFCVGSWHGPVAFGPPAKVQMAVLVNVAAAHAMLEFAKGTPCVLAGDFNQVPSVSVKGAPQPNPPYTLLTTGTLPADSPGIPPARAGDSSP